MLKVNFLSFLFSEETPFKRLKATHVMGVEGSNGVEAAPSSASTWNSYQVEQLNADNLFDRRISSPISRIGAFVNRATNYVNQLTSPNISDHMPAAVHEQGSHINNSTPSMAAVVKEESSYVSLQRDVMHASHEEKGSPSDPVDLTL